MPHEWSSALLTDRRLNAELKGIITMRYSETLVKTCTARVLGLPTHSKDEEGLGGKEGCRGKRRAGGEEKQRPLV